MQLGTVWNNCVLIYLNGELGGYAPILSEEIESKWELYKNTTPDCKHYNGWYDLESGICFSGAQFRGSYSGLDYHFNDDRQTFLIRKWGREFVRRRIDNIQTFKLQPLIFNDEYVLSKPPTLNQFSRKSVLIIGGGPNTKTVNWSNLKCDFIWSCNKFYRNGLIRQHQVDLVSLASNVKLLGNHKLESYLRQTPTLVAFEISKTNDVQAWESVRLFVEKYQSRCSFFHLRYASLLGVGARLLLYAIFLGVKDIYFVGFDGMTKAGTRHSFERFKKNPSWYTQGGDHLQRRQFVIFWDYVLGLKVHYDFNLYNLGEGYAHNVSSDISQKVFPLTDRLKEQLF